MILRKILFIAVLTWFSLTVIGYGIYKALPIILGPKIDLSTPHDGQIVEGTSIPVRGTVYRTHSLFINSVPVTFTESGSFSSRVPVYPGSNILVLEVHDKFGRVTTEILNIGTK